jgi:ABC-type transport system involved in cytochrome c biogenesis permease subunit
MLAYVILLKSAIIALHQFVAPVDDRRTARDSAIFRLVRFGFPLLTVGLVLGAWWGKLAWGDYWNWDPKELWSLATWLVFAGYLHIRSAYGPRFARLNAALVLCGCQCIVLTLVWVNLAGRLFAGLHTYAT